MAHMKAMGVNSEKAVELQGLRDVYANVLQGEGKMIHVGDIQPWSTGLGFGGEQESVVQKQFCETFPEVLWYEIA